LRIDRIETRINEHALFEERAIVSSLGRHTESRFLTITVIDADGRRGYGEAAMAPVWSGEAAETAQWLAENLFAPQLVGHHFDHPSEPLRRLDRAFHGLPFLKAGLDVAVWDLWAKIQDSSVSKLIADREPLSSVPTRVSIGGYSPAETLRLAVQFWDAGIRTLKFKTGVPPFDDVERLRVVRERLGSEPVITVDANGAYQAEDEAVAAIESLLPFDLALVEQPTPRDRIGMLARVRRRVPVPILADECVFTPGHLAEALDCDAFDLLSVYPGKNGGFTHSLEMARTAQKAGKSCVIGSNLETDLGQAAMVCLPASLTAFPVREYACDLMSALFYRKSSTNPPIVLRDGVVETPQGIGFGVEPADESASDH
jgi:L-alanine-DL-glutamate epimerase-like enolase superfamily enzyme